jgi:hydroxymethylglutaryl-CoA reductase
MVIEESSVVAAAANAAKFCPNVADLNYGLNTEKLAKFIHFNEVQRS